MKILALAAHADDELLGPGGTLIRHARGGDEVHVAVCVGRPNLAMYSGARYGNAVLTKRRRQAEKVCKTLGFKKLHWLGLKDEMLEQDLNSTVSALEHVVKAVRPEIVYLHHGGDVNQDHRGVFKAGLVSLRGYLEHPVRRVLAFETVSTTEQAPPRTEWQFRPNVYVDIRETLAAKIAALKIYDDELRDFPHPRSEQGLRALAQVRGSAAGFAAAEAFELVRERVEDLSFSSIS